MSVLELDEFNMIGLDELTFKHLEYEGDVVTVLATNAYRNLYTTPEMTIKIANRMIELATDDIKANPS